MRASVSTMDFITGRATPSEKVDIVTARPVSYAPNQPVTVTVPSRVI